MKRLQVEPTAELGALLPVTLNKPSPQGLNRFGFIAWVLVKSV
jgi:hypothetical protein